MAQKGYNVARPRTHEHPTPCAHPFIPSHLCLMGKKAGLLPCKKEEDGMGTWMLMDSHNPYRLVYYGGHYQDPKLPLVTLDFKKAFQFNRLGDAEKSSYFNGLKVAERMGFEPTRQLITICALSRGVPSTTRPPLRQEADTGECGWKARALSPAGAISPFAQAGACRAPVARVGFARRPPLPLSLAGSRHHHREMGTKLPSFGEARPSGRCRGSRGAQVRSRHPA